MAFTQPKPGNNNTRPEPLLKRNVAEEMHGLTFEAFLFRYKEEHPYAQLDDEAVPGFNEFDGKIQYLIDTVVDMTAMQLEIHELWDLVIDRLLPQADSIMSENSVYFFPLMSITGEAAFELEDRKKIMNRLESAIFDLLTARLKQNERQGEVINDLNRWLNAESEYHAYLGIGRSYSDIGRLANIHDAFKATFEELKQSAPNVYVDFVTMIKAAYAAVPSDYQIKFFELIQHLTLQVVLVSRNAGFFDHYDKALKEYYQLKLEDQKFINWAYQTFTGYGEKPWRLVYLLLTVNAVFALLFTLGPFKFYGIDPHGCGLARFGNFLYFNNTSMLTIGYGDIYPKDAGGKFSVVILQLIGFSISSAAVALFLRRILRF